MTAHREIYRAEDSAIVLIDHQTPPGGGIDQIPLITNVTLLARVARHFDIPVILTATQAEGSPGLLWPQLTAVLADSAVIRRTSLNPWDDGCFRKRVYASGRRNLVVAGLWMEVCVVWPVIEMMDAGYQVFVVEDCCAGESPTAQQAALARMTQAGAVLTNTISALVQFQKGIERSGQHPLVMDFLRQYAFAIDEPAPLERRPATLHDAPPGAPEAEATSSSPAPGAEPPGGSNPPVPKRRGGRPS
jgi:nicotinamidase-related amidase